MASGLISPKFTAAWADEHSRYYFVNNEDQSTTWEWPDEVPKPEGEIAGWTGAKDPSSGNIYYVGPDQSTQWEVPDPVIQDAIGKYAAAAAAQAAPAAAAPAAAEPAAAEPAAAEPAAAPAAAGGADAAALAAAAEAAEKAVASGAGEGGAAEGGEPKPVSFTRGLTPVTKSCWSKILQYCVDQAQEKISTRNATFERLRAFNKIRMKKKREEEKARAEEAKEHEMELAAEKEERLRREKLSVMDMQAIKLGEAPDRKSLEDYATEYCLLARKGMFKTNTTVAKLLSHKPEVIKMPLLKSLSSGEMSAMAIQCFRNATGFMGDRSSGKGDEGHAEKLLKNCLSGPEDLRDEVYLQIIKQSTNNSNPQSLLKAWQLFGVVTGGVAPSKTLEPYLASHFNTAKDTHPPTTTGVPGIHEYAEYSLGRLMKITQFGVRAEIPTSLEIEASKYMLPFLVRVYFVDGTYEMMPVQSWMTPSDLANQVLELLGVYEENRQAFKIYELTPENEERCLDDDERIADLVAYWQRLYDEQKSRDARDADAQTFRIALKVHVYIDPTPNKKGEPDKAAEKLMYTQAVYDVVSARYPCSEDDQLSLGALQRQCEKPNTNVTPNELHRYINAKLIGGTRSAELTAELNKRLAAHKSKAPSQCRSDYMDHVRKWKVYGSSFFWCRTQMSATLPEEVFLAVNPKGILCINPETKAVLEEYTYDKIPTWGHSGSSFVLHVGTLMRQTKLYFQTPLGKDINQLVRAYVNHMAAQQ